MDLHSGKLHREFHHGPDPTQEVAQAQNVDDAGNQVQDQQTGQAPADQPPPADGAGHDHNSPQEVFGLPPSSKTSPPLSVFQKLKPSRTRYTLRDEL